MSVSGTNSGQVGSRVAVIGGEPLFRIGLILALRASKIVDVVGEGTSTSDAVRLAESHPLDLVLVDLDVQGSDIEKIIAFRHLWPAVKIVLLARSEREEDVSASLRAGVSGYILRSVEPGELLNALQQVMRGEIYLTPALGALLVTRTCLSGAYATAPKPVPVKFTPREDEVLAEVARGATNKEIARALHISDKTVKYFMTNIMQKLQVRNRVEAVLAARMKASNTAVPSI